MPEAKTVCRLCGAPILLTTAERTGGFCMPCKRLIPTSPFDPVSMRSDVNGLIEKHPCLAPVAERILAETCVEMQMVRVWDEAVPCGCSRFGGVPDLSLIHISEPTR